MSLLSVAAPYLAPKPSQPPSPIPPRWTYTWPCTFPLCPSDTHPSSLRHQGPHVHHHEICQPGDVTTGGAGEAEGDGENITSTPSVTNFPGSCAVSSSPCSTPPPTRRTPSPRAPRSHTSSRLSTRWWGTRMGTPFGMGYGALGDVEESGALQVCEGVGVEGGGCRC